MKIISPSVEILDRLDGAEILRKIERAGRVCYKSEDKITDTSAEAFVRNLIKNGHESVLEHEKITVRIICDRGVSHELVRHRLASYSQESTRYCNYSKGTFDGEITVIRPCFIGRDWEPKATAWRRACEAAEKAYFELLGLGVSIQGARSVLPNSLKTEVIMTANLREWRAVLRLRASPAAHPSMREVMCMLLAQFRERVPVVFEDINP